MCCDIFNNILLYIKTLPWIYVWNGTSYCCYKQSVGCFLLLYLLNKVVLWEVLCVGVDLILFKLKDINFALLQDQEILAADGLSCGELQEWYSVLFSFFKLEEIVILLGKLCCIFFSFNCYGWTIVAETKLIPVRLAATCFMFIMMRHTNIGILNGLNLIFGDLSNGFSVSPLRLCF